jgi:alpha-ketoglutarate-dependent taurine dioxygenase
MIIVITTKLLNSDWTLPLVVEPESSNGGGYDANRLVAWYKENEAFIDEKLLEHGAILFRGFGVSTPAAFARFTRSVSSHLLESMEENVPRTKLSSGVYTSTEYPPEYMLSMHSEYSYSNRWPGKLFFCCVTAAKQGGETPLADNRAVLNDLDSKIVKDFAEKKVKYLRNLHSGKGFGLSWQTAFQTTDKSVVEDYCRKTSVEFQWKPDDGLRLSQTLAGIITHPKTGDTVWFNQAPQFHPSDYPHEIYQSLLAAYKNEDELPQNVCFGDDSPIDPAVLDTVRETMRKRAVAFPWHEGDVVMVDNVLASHGRMPFVGPRKVLVAMAEK